MATPEINGNCHCVQNYPHRCKIKLEKFLFDILCCFGVIKESLPGGRNPPPPGARSKFWGVVRVGGQGWG